MSTRRPLQEDARSFARVMLPLGGVPLDAITLHLDSADEWMAYHEQADYAYEHREDV